MDRFSRIDFCVEGLSVERLLNHCAKQGIRLKNVRRRSLRAVAASATPQDFAALRTFAQERGWHIVQEKAAGVSKLRGVARGRALLVCGIAAFLAICWVASACVWFIDVSGAGPYEAEVRRILAEYGVRPGRFSAAIDAKEIQRTMETELTGLSWVGVHKSGVRVNVQCVQAEVLPEIEEAPRNLVAARDGIVASVLCQAGTPRVAPGDMVRTGDILIEGVERGSEGSFTPVCAKGSVQARVWYTGEAFVSSVEEQIELTGEEKMRRVLYAPAWEYEYAFETPPDFTQYELESRIQPIGGALPVFLRTEIYRQTRTVTVARPDEQVRKEAAQAALRLAGESAGWELEILDKWVEYSMIEKEGYRAKAVVEALCEIAYPEPTAGIR